VLRALEGMGRGDPRIAEALFAATQDPVQRVALAAVRALATRDAALLAPWVSGALARFEDPRDPLGPQWVRLFASLGPSAPEEVTRARAARLVRLPEDDLTFPPRSSHAHQGRREGRWHLQPACSQPELHYFGLAGCLTRSQPAPYWVTSGTSTFTSSIATAIAGHGRHSIGLSRSRHLDCRPCLRSQAEEPLCFAFPFRRASHLPTYARS
jgi:hypothetical protein